MRIAISIAVVCWSALACAQAEAPLAPEEKQAQQERAKALHEQADVRRQEAEAAFAVETRACWDKFLVSRCQDEAKKTRVDRLTAARALDQEARDIERELRRREFAAREARRAAEEPQRAAEAAAQAERNRQAQQEAMERVERRQREADGGGRL